MDKMEEERINKNLSELLKLTTIDESFVAHFVAAGILSPCDVDVIHSKNSSLEKADNFYRIIQTRKDSYTHLILALRESKQIGVLEILDHIRPESSLTSFPDKITYDRSARLPRMPIPSFQNTVVAILDKINDPKSILAKTVDKIRYDRSAILGRGSRSCVYRGSFGTNKAAVKVIYIRDAFKDVLKYRLESFMHSICHENVLGLLAYKVEPEVRQILLAIEFCDTTLEEYVENKGNKILHALISPLETVTQAINGLDYLHTQNIHHGDIKPSNILLVQTNASVVVKVADFGIRNYMEEERSSVTLTVTLDRKCWQAPEILDYWDWKEKCRKDSKLATTKKKIGYSSDIFALGCVFYYTVSGGNHPFGVTRREITKNIDFDNPVLDGKYDHPTGTCLLVRHMVARNAANRPAASDILTHSIFCSAEKSHSRSCKVELQRKPCLSR